MEMKDWARVQKVRNTSSAILSLKEKKSELTESDSELFLVSQWVATLGAAKTSQKESCGTLKANRFIVA